MKNLFRCWAVLLLFTAQSFAQVTFPEPDSIATKEWVRKYVAGQTVEPVAKDCQHELTLVSISKQTTSGAEYNFYSVGVENLVEVIYNTSDIEVFRHRTQKVTRDRIWLPYNLPPGRYKLKIFNADCKAESKAVDFVIGDAADPVPDPGPIKTGFVNPGVYSQKAGALLYEWIPTEQVDLVVSGGKVKLIAPATKQSWDGKNTCRRFVLGDLYDNKLSDSDEQALFGEGLALPAGHYAFKILYLNAPNWAKARQNMWPLVGFNLPGGEGYSHSAQVEMISLSITDDHPIHGLDPNLWRVSWLPQYQLLPHSLQLPGNKVFGITRYLTNVPKDSLLAKVSRIQYTYSWIDQVSKAKAWRNLRAEHHGLKEPDWHIANAILDKDYVLLSEYAENYGNLVGCPPCYDKSEEIYRGIYQRFVNEQGVTSPAQTWLVSDYFSPLYGGSFGMSFDHSAANLSKGLSSVHFARSSLSDDGRWNMSAYFSRGWYSYRNYLSQGYLPHLLGQAGKPGLYSRIYNHEKANLALADRKKLTYVTNAQEGLHHDLITISGTWYKAKLAEGELLRVDGIVHPFQTLLSDAFFALLLSDAFVIWESNVTLNPDPYTFDVSWFGGKEEWKTRWKPTGAKPGTYAPGLNGPVRKKADGQFPEKPMVGDEGAFVGAKLYEAIAGKVEQLYYPDFTLNGKTVIAKRGTKGQAVSYAGLQNEGQDNLVKLFENDLPVVIKGTGPKGAVLIYQNPHASLTEVQGLEVEGRFFQITGNRLHLLPL